MEAGVALPDELQPFAGAIELTRKPIIAIGVQDEKPSDAAASRTRWHSMVAVGVAISFG